MQWTYQQKLPPLENQNFPISPRQHLLGVVDSSHQSSYHGSEQLSSSQSWFWIMGLPRSTHDEFSEFWLPLCLSKLFPSSLASPHVMPFWQTLEAALASASNTRILQLHMERHQEWGYYWYSISMRSQKSSHELSATSSSLSSQDFNIYVLEGLNPHFCDLALWSPITYSELHSLILSHEFMNLLSFSQLWISMTEGAPPSPQANVARNPSLLGMF